jgi:CSLREA domain-containing protein
VPVGLKAATLAPTGAVFVVTSANDAVDANLANGTCATASGACTLRAAIQQANALAGLDTIQIPAGTYALAIRPQNQNLADTGDLDVTGPVTIVGAGPESTIVDGGTPTSNAPEIRGLDRLFEIHPGAGDVSFVELTLREGYSAEQGGGIYNASTGRLLLEQVRVLESYAAKYGGGIANAGSGRVELVGSRVTGNGAKEGGSAIHNAVEGTVSITAGSAIADNPGNSGNPADDYTVTGGAINNEGEGDTIGTIEILDSTVSGNGASSNGAGIYNERDGRVVVRRSTITGNRSSSSGGGIYSVSGTVLIQEGTTISDNHAGSDISSGDGGGVYNAGQLSKAGTPGRLEIANATITGNTSTGDGAGISCGLDADLVITDSTISDNAAGGEGGGVSSQAKADMTVTRATFSGNSAEVAGGGVYAYAEGAASFADTLFTGNTAGETGGGGLYTDGSGGVAVVRSTFVNNTSVGDGGGLVTSSSGEQTITDSVVRNNHTDEGGGGIFNSGLGVTFERLSITGNTALLDGGGIKSEGSAQFTILDTTVSGNSAENGGGFTNAADGTMRVSSSTFRDNAARGDGGGYLEIGDANSEIENTTLSGNRAGDRGGGVYTNADATLRVVNVTITDNTAMAGSGLSTSVESLNFPVVPATAVILRNTIVAGNHDGINCHGAVFSEGGNLDDGTTCFFSDARDITRTAPGVQPLADYGGATFTHALAPTSVAIDRGVNPCPDVDQRGVARPQNAGCDIGAYEFEGTPGEPDANPLPPPTGPDSDPPTVSLDQKPAIRTLDTFAEFRFRADELANFECVLDPATGASFSGCESPHDYTNLALGLHTFQVRAIDASRNVGQPVTYTWRVVEELVPPETTISSGPPSLTRSTSASLTFSANEPASFECSLDQAAYATCASPLALSALADGTHTVEVRAIDNSFNVDESPASRTWAVDTTAPETTIDTGPSGLTNDAIPAFGFSSEAGATFECALDAAAFAACSPPYAIDVPLAEGAHTFAVRATDAAGNTDPSPADRAFTVDTIAPQTTIEAGPNGLINSRTPTFEFSADEQGPTFECSLDAAAFAACTSPYSTPSLSEGAHTFGVRAVDQAGNQDGSAASRTFTIDTTAPETTIDSGPPALTRSTSADVTFSANEAATFVCALDGAVAAACTSPLELSALADGPHTLDVQARDDAGNTDQTPARRTWTVDTTPPETTIDSGPSGPTNDATPAFGFSSETGATFECALDAAAFTACSPPYALDVLLADGAHTFHVRAVDAAGNEDLSPASRSFTVDTVAPDTTIDSGPSGLTNDTTPTFTFSSEAGATLECALDTGAYAACTSPHTAAALSEGAHTFQVRASDAAGNEDSTPASRAFTVDTIAPETTILEGPSGATSDSTPTFTFSSETGATFECALDNGAFAGCASPQTTAVLTDGPHTFDVRATDAAGNADLSPASRAFSIDAGPPETAIDSGPSGVTTSTSATFRFSAGEPSSFECKLDNGAFASCTSPQDYATLGDGAHTFSVRAIDSAGNRDESPATRTWTVDTAPPQTTIDSGPNGATNVTTPTFTFTSEAGSSFECRVDAAALAACSSPHTTATLADGPHTFEVQAIDAAGNRDASPAARSFAVDRRAPTIALTGPPAETAETSARFEFSASEPTTGFRCSLDGAAQASCSSPVDRTGLALGPHTFRVEASDAAGNTGSATHAWTIKMAPDTTAPVVTISGPPSSTSSTSATFTFTANEPATFECSLESAPLTGCTSGATYSGLTPGEHVFRVRATDSAQNQSITGYVWRVTDSTAPVVTITSAPESSTSSTTATFAFSASEPATFRCSIDGGTAAACDSAVSYSGLAPGQHTFLVQATDSDGNVGSASHSWTVVASGGCTAGGTVTLGANADTWVLQSSATSNYGSDSAIKVDTKAGANARVLVRFGLPAIPSGCRVVAAKLRMYAGSYKTGRTLQAAALTAAWNESSVTWSNQPASGGPAATVASGSGYREWEVGPHVSGMYASGNNGFVIRDASEDGQGVEQAFNSREKGTDNPPQLVLTFG